MKFKFGTCPWCECSIPLKDVTRYDGFCSHECFDDFVQEHKVPTHVTQEKP